jgi:formylglycine-generating enzyme required for sulfatase activity
LASSGSVFQDYGIRTKLGTPNEAWAQRFTGPSGSLQQTHKLAVELNNNTVSYYLDGVLLKTTAVPGWENSASMVLVQGGTLPAGSALAGQTVATFQIGKYEVTWEEWQSVRAYAIANGYDLANAGQGSAENNPVRNVSWYDAVKWANAKSQMEGFSPVYTANGTIFKTGQSSPTSNPTANGYRLPAEAEWEWAARGGVSRQGYTYSGSNDVNAVAWYFDNSSGAAVNLYGDGRGTWPVGQKAANELGIHDMSGNVWEWCWDVGDGSFRRHRGGSWTNAAANAAVAGRGGSSLPEGRNGIIGFRLARTTTASIAFSYTGASQAWVVPANVTQITFDLKGAAGGTASGGGWTVYGGLGASVTGTLKVTPGETLYFFIGGSGDDCQNKTTVNGGFNGGGSGANNSGSGGGGATDIRMGGLALGNRVIVAGGGGGANTIGGYGGQGGGVGPFNSVLGLGTNGVGGGGGGGYYGGTGSLAGYGQEHAHGGSNYSDPSKTLGVLNTNGGGGSNGTKSDGSATISYQLN